MNVYRILLAGACLALAACATTPGSTEKVAKANATGTRTDAPALDVATPAPATLYSQGWVKDEDNKSKN